MPIIHPRGTRAGPGTADRPAAEPSGPAVQVLFREARRRERRRRAVALAVLLALGGLAFGLLAAVGGPPPPRPGTGGSSGSTPGAPGTAAGHFTFRGNGIGGAAFGQPQAVAIAELDKVLGLPTTPRPAGDAGNCTVDAYLTWPTMTAYFFHGRFVGYNSASLLAAPGSGAPDVIPGAPTAAGLRIGDGIARARRIYGSAFVVLFSQGGSWRVTTSTGILDGYLTAVPDRPTPPAQGRGRQRGIGGLPRSLTLIDANARHACRTGTPSMSRCAQAPRHSPSTAAASLAPGPPADTIPVPAKRPQARAAGRTGTSNSCIAPATRSSDWVLPGKFQAVAGDGRQGSSGDGGSAAYDELRLAVRGRGVVRPRRQRISS